MGYDISGDFIEACDCFVVCPCWVDDDPDGGHCTGLFAWSIGDGSRIDGVDVAGCTVVSVSAHAGNRRGGGTATALFVDRGADPDQFTVLTKAFGGELDGPLRDLASVSGAVLQRQPADIAIATSGNGWRISVDVGEETGSVRLLHVTGAPRSFDHEDHALTLRHTALSHELGVPPGAHVTAQQGGEMAVHLAVLPGGYIEVTDRSGMRGRFSYHLAEQRLNPDEPDEPDQPLGPDEPE